MMIIVPFWRKISVFIWLILTSLAFFSPPGMLWHIAAFCKAAQSDIMMCYESPDKHNPQAICSCRNCTNNIVFFLLMYIVSSWMEPRCQKSSQEEAGKLQFPHPRLYHCHRSYKLITAPNYCLPASIHPPVTFVNIFCRMHLHNLLSCLKIAEDMIDFELHH